MQKYSIRKDIFPSMLSIADLKELIEIMKSTFSNPILYLSSNSNNFKTTESNLELFFKNRLPDTLDNLSINVYENDYSSDISLNFQESYIFLSLQGKEEWVLGKISKIENFLKEKRPWWAIFTKYNYIMQFISLSFFWLLIMYFIGGGVVNLFLISIFFLFLPFFIFSLFWKKLFPYTKIIINQPKSNFNLNEYVPLIGLIIGIIGLVMNFLK